MSKKMMLVAALLMIVPVMLGACGGDKQDKAQEPKTTLVPLPQTVETASGIVLKLPDGWVSEEISGGVRATNREEFLAAFAAASLQEIPAGMLDLEAQVLPLKALVTSDQTSMKGVLTELLPKMIGSDPTVKSTEVEAIKVGDREAARVRVTSDQMAGAIHLVKLDDANVILVSYLARPDEITTNQDLLAQVVDAVDYTAPQQ